jgi:hypothetical protein
VVHSSDAETGWQHALLLETFLMRPLCRFAGQGVDNTGHSPRSSRHMATWTTAQLTASIG